MGALFTKVTEVVRVKHAPHLPPASTVYLLPQVLAFAARARAQGVAVELSVAPGMVHVFPLFAPFGPSGGEPAKAMGRAAAFLDRVLGVAAAGGAALGQDRKGTDLALIT